VITRNHVIENFVFTLDNLNEPFQLTLPISSPAQILSAELTVHPARSEQAMPSRSPELALCVVAASTAVSQVVVARVCFPGRPFPLSRSCRGTRLQIFYTGEPAETETGLLVLEPQERENKNEDEASRAERMSLEEFLRMLFGL
jgi:hypothetical protein